MLTVSGTREGQLGHDAGMDEGWAALAAGVAALAGAVASGWYAGRSARQGAEKAAEAVLRQVVDQGAIEHGHWLREQRQGAYLAFITEWDNSLAAMDQQWMRVQLAVGSPLQSDGISLNEIRDIVEEAVNSTTASFERLKMLGPPNVEEPATNLRRALVRLNDAVTELSFLPLPSSVVHDKWDHVRPTVFDLRRPFIAAVQAVLQSPPSPRAPSGGP